MTGNDKIFLASLGSALVLLGAGMAHNIAGPSRPPVSGMTTVSSVPAAHTDDVPQTQLIEEEFNRMGLPLHEGKHWISL